MGTELLAVPDDQVADMCVVIRAGLKASPNISAQCRARLESWLLDMEANSAEDMPFFEGEEADG